MISYETMKRKYNILIKGLWLKRGFLLSWPRNPPMKHWQCLPPKARLDWVPRKFNWQCANTKLKERGYNWCPGPFTHFFRAVIEVGESEEAFVTPLTHVAPNNANHPHRFYSHEVTKSKERKFLTRSQRMTYGCHRWTDELVASSWDMHLFDLNIRFIDLPP